MRMVGRRGLASALLTLSLLLNNHVESQLGLETEILYITGVFTNYTLNQETTTLRGIAELQPGQGVLGPLGLGLDLPSEGFQLVGDVSGQGLYVAGSYSVANGEEVARITHVVNGSMLPVDLGASNSVYTLTLHEPSNRIYMGGVFTEVTGVAVGYVTAYNGSDWDVMGGGVGLGYDCQVAQAKTTPRISAVVHTMQLMGGDETTMPKVFVGGHFTTAGVGDDAVEANNIAMWNPETGKWENLCDPLPPNRCNIQGVSDDARREDVQHPIVFALALHESSNRLFVGGIFASAGQMHNYIDALSTFNLVTRAWEMVGKGVAGRNPVVYSILIKEDKVYVAGSFQHVEKSNTDTFREGIRAHSCAVFDASTNTWASLGGQSLGEAIIYSIDIGLSGTIYAVGEIGDIAMSDEAKALRGGDASAQNIAKYTEAAGWQPVLPGGSQLDGVVHSVHAKPFVSRVQEVVSSRVLDGAAVSSSRPWFMVSSLLFASSAVVLAAAMV
jgi:hypothetical protein